MQIQQLRLKNKTFKDEGWNLYAFSTSRLEKGPFSWKKGWNFIFVTAGHTVRVVILLDIPITINTRVKYSTQLRLQGFFSRTEWCAIQGYTYIDRGEII